ncbi:P2 family phage major capsid protein [Proteus mirabilis]|nr:P2 family phage major capsid protein [Proteus mirabilis]
MSIIVPQGARVFHENFTRGVKYTLSGRYFSLSEPSTNLIRVALMDSNWLIKQLTVADVDEERGDTVNLGDNSLHTGRELEGRFYKNIDFNGTPFTLEETDTCCSLTYQQLSLICNSGSGDDDHVYKTMSDYMSKAIALDMLRIGFNGYFRNYPTNPQKFPKGQDVNIGWHAIAKATNEGAQIITDKMTLGKDGKFPNLDALVNYLIMQKIPEEYREDPRLVVLVGAELAGMYRTSLFNGSNSPSDLNASQKMLSSIAGRLAIVPPFMPGRRIVVTTLDNLHIYTQKGTRLFRAEFVGERKVYEHSYLRQEGYGLGDINLYAAIDESAIEIEEGIYSL